MRTPRVAIVTGAASGMGRLAAERLAAAGTQVAAVDLQAQPLEDLAATSPNIHAYTCDSTDAAAVGATAAKIIAELGDPVRLVNAAGIGPSGPLAEVPLDQFRKVMDVNYFGTVYWVRALLPTMRARGSGELVLFASTAGWIPAIGMGAYCASKFAVVAFAEILAEEVRSEGIRVLCVCPPPVETPLLADLAEHSPIGKGLERVKPTPAAVIIDAIDRALPKRTIFVFPKAKAMWRLRRFAPRLSWRLFYWATSSGQARQKR